MEHSCSYTQTASVSVAHHLRMQNYHLGSRQMIQQILHLFLFSLVSAPEAPRLKMEKFHQYHELNLSQNIVCSSYSHKHELARMDLIHHCGVQIQNSYHRIRQMSKWRYHYHLEVYS